MSSEAIRLVIWDLDDTFWHGTLSEGGIVYRRDVHDIVVTLARRGIVSSICSKNDLAEVQAVLQREGLWTYFILPSIDWSPKGPRLKTLVDAVQLRPSTVLFIDDNPMNLAEAQHYLPDISVGSDAIIPTLPDDPRLRGKDDKELTRLAQYRVLQDRHTGLTAAKSDTTEFLRQSGITVVIEHDLEPHLDRVVELINRTNQLNYTKNRLPEDLQAARAELRTSLSHHTVQAGLLRVQDRYGDYGYCGFYALHGQYNKPKHLLHFCFSCRILNMGVETWLYRVLGKPRLRIVGEVATKLTDIPADIDWISREDSHAAQAGTEVAKFDHVFFRGGCDIHALAHYFRAVSRRVEGEFNVVRHGRHPIISHSVMLKHALDGISAEAREAARPFGFVDEDFTSFLTHAPADERGLWLLSFTHDNWTPLYRHRLTGELIPVHVEGARQPTQNYLTRTASESRIPPELLDHL